MLKSLKGTAAEFLEAVPDAIVVTDGGGRVVFINTTAVSLLGYRPEECVGRIVEMFIPERFRRQHDDSVGQYYADAQPRTMAAGKDLVARHKNGREIPVDISLSPLPTDNGVLVIAAIRDVSERRRAEEALRESEARLLAAVENLPFSFCACDADGRCFMQNAASRETWGDRIGQRIEDTGMDDDAVARWDGTRRRVMAGKVVHWEEASTRDGQTRVEYTIIAPIQRDGRVTGFLRVGIDVTERHRALDLEVRLRASEESERLKDALLGTVSHELRSPISVIHGYATTALEYAGRLSPDELIQYFRDIDSATLRLERLVSDLLIMSRLDAGALTMDLQPMDIVPVVHEAVRTTGIAARQREFRTATESASIRVEGDPARLLEVLSNLLENADKFSPEGEPVEVSVETADENLVKVSVRDRGSGIPPRELDAIFGRFYRGAAGGRTPVSGAGLGLAICRSIIQAHGGRIWASLPAGGGLQITFSLRQV